ncbi:MAG: Asp-tRNA(Asn)/Glu-tRNA(Gln) amidotransferase subunit GatA, partial [Deltaproteobacteria bacterium]|nr:Asp-tRNA(Asn)/Glu-tRNA(Gln) amidotransferase subunit GatA [Deltaproteobacteria bacterium]
MHLCDRTASELGTMLMKGEVCAREILESVFQRIDERESSLNAYITKTPELALKQAEQADARFLKDREMPPLNGIPIAVKDNLCTRGIKTTCGSKILFNYIPPYDASAVGKVIRNGAVMVGKTNMDEFGMGSSTENSAFGPTRNPVNTDCVAGG